MGAVGTSADNSFAEAFNAIAARAGLAIAHRIMIDPDGEPFTWVVCGSPITGVEAINPGAASEGLPALFRPLMPLFVGEGECRPVSGASLLDG